MTGRIYTYPAFQGQFQGQHAVHDRTMNTNIIIVVYMYILTLCVYNLNATFCNSSQAIIVSQPLDLTVKEEEDAVFSCTVSRFNPDTDVIEWVINPPVYSIVRSNTFDPFSKEMTSSIGFSNIGRGGHSQRCISKILNSYKQWTMCISRQSVLNVLYFPKRKDLQCSPNRVKYVREEESIRISCEVLQGNPPVNLTWIKEGINIPQSKSYLRDNSQIIWQDLTINRSFHNKTIECSVRNEEFFPGEELKCIIGPLMVLRQPLFHVHPTHATLRNPEELMNLSCEGTAYPPIQMFRWFCVPSDVFHGCNAYTSTINLRLSNSIDLSALNGSEVLATCLSKNSEGVSTTTSTITISLPAVYNTYFEKNCTGEVLKLQQLYVNGSVRNIASSFLCTVEQINSYHGKAGISWYLDETPLTHAGGGSLTVEQHSSTSSLLTIKNTAARTPRIITCEYIIGNCKTTKTIYFDDKFKTSVAKKSTVAHSTLLKDISTTKSYAKTAPHDNVTYQDDNNSVGASSGKDHILLITGICFVGGILIAAFISAALKVVFSKSFQQRTINAESVQSFQVDETQKRGLSEGTCDDAKPIYEEPSVSTEKEMQEGRPSFSGEIKGYDTDVFKTYYSSLSSSMSSMSSCASDCSIALGNTDDYSSLNMSSKSTDSRDQEGIIHLYLNQEVVEMHCV